MSRIARAHSKLTYRFLQTFYIEHFKMPSYESGGRNNFWCAFSAALKPTS